MSSMIIARFDSVPLAKSAAHAFFAEGFREGAVILFRGEFRVGQVPSWSGYPQAQVDQVRSGMVWCTVVLAAAGALLGTLAALFLLRGIFVVTGGAVLGAGAGAAAGAWWAGRRLMALNRARLHNAPAAGQAVLLAVHVEPGEEDAAMALLRDAGGFQVECEYGRWHGGRWSDRESARHARVSHRAQWLP